MKVHRQPRSIATAVLALGANVSCQSLMSMFDKLGFPPSLRCRCRGVFLCGILLTVSAAHSWAQPGVRLATRQFLTPDGAPYLEVQAEIMAEGLQWLMSSDSLVRAGVEWTVVAYDTTGAVAGFSKATARTGALTQAGTSWTSPAFHWRRPHVWSFR